MQKDRSTAYDNNNNNHEENDPINDDATIVNQNENNDNDNDNENHDHIDDDHNDDYNNEYNQKKTIDYANKSTGSLILDKAEGFEGTSNLLLE